MIKVCFLGPLSALGECEYDCANLSELKETLSKDERLTGWLKDCAISLNDEIITDL
ncbi:molybdopterin synthase sulfur carrier subunit, partial [Campylobacter sp.]